MATYPSQLATFLVADSIRIEVGGKATLLGAFAGGKILVDPSAKFPVAFPFSVYAVFEDGDGSFETKIRMTDPAGKSIIGDVPMGITNKEKGTPMQLAVNFNIFQFSSAGIYRVEIFLDDHVYVKEVSIAVSDKPIPR